MVGVAPFLVRLLTAQTVDETTSIPLNCRGYQYLTFWLTGTGTTSSGVVTLEQAVYDPNTQGIYTGTWSPISVFNASDVSGGMQKTYQMSVADYAFVRARISTAIGGGGSITCDLTGH